MYIAICDDQEQERGTLQHLLYAWQRERQHPVRVRVFRSPVELLDAAREEPFTLYLLDVLMPGMDGMAAAREVPGVLRQYEAQLLAREEFMRIHRSYIVNMLQVAAFAPTEVRTFSGRSLPVSRLLYPQLQKDYLALLFHGRKE